MMLFWILAITDLIMVGITWAVYGSSATYRDGMLLGVHLPESAASLPPVVQLTDSYKKTYPTVFICCICFLGVAVAAPFFLADFCGYDPLVYLALCVFDPCSLFAVQCPPSTVSSEAGSETMQ